MKTNNGFDDISTPQSKVTFLLLSDSALALKQLNGQDLLSNSAAAQFDFVALDQLDRQTDVTDNMDAMVLWIEQVSSLTPKVVTRLEKLVQDSMPIIIVTDNDQVCCALANIKQYITQQYRPSEISIPLIRSMKTYAAAARRARQAVQNSYTQFVGLLDAVPDAVIVCAENGIVESGNKAAEQMFDVHLHLEPRQYIEDFIADEYREMVRDILTNANARSADSDLLKYCGRVEGVRHNGVRFPMQLNIQSAIVGNKTQFTCVLRDITQEKNNEQELQLASTAFETHTAILITDATGKILRINPAFTQITGYSEAEAVGNNPSMLQSGYQGPEFYESFWATIRSTGKWEGEIWNRRKNGEIYPEWQTITAVKNDNGETTHYVATFQDITERKQTQALIEHHAFYDALTNLPNRRMILERMNQELSASRRHQTMGALLFLDLDHFKTLNDSMGHAVGDLLLQQMGERLTKLIRKEDTVARLGGDEFVVLLSNLGSNLQSVTAMATNIAKKIHGRIVEPYQLENSVLSFTSSIGITVFPLADDSADDVLKHADAAMYRAKNKGRNTICFYQPSMQAEADQRLMLEKELREALHNDQFVLYYQPQFSNQGYLVGVEALLRWNHPYRGIVQPGEFIALSEEINLIQPIGIWVIKSALQQYRDWRNSGFFTGHEYIAINVSPKQMQQENFVAKIAELFTSEDLPPQCLKLELTESVLLHDIQDVVTKMNQLKALGVTFSMDDFGTGFSSLSYLKRLPFDQIKIDKTFISDVVSDMNDAAIVETIIAMAEHLNLDVIAEGVETREEFEFLQRKGCRNYQGFYFSTPLQASSLEQTLQLPENADVKNKVSAK